MMINFGALSFSSMALGSVALSILTVVGRGNRTFALIMAAVSIFMGVYMWSNLSDYGQIPASLGMIALVIALLPSKKRPPAEEED
ncbi:MAG: hypothetical protein RLZZ90_1082 [Actinomycetota bacterium]